MNQNFFVSPFASLGDQTAIPITTDPNGYVSFQQGWGPDYAADPATNANAKDIDRANTNYLFYIITQALAALQGETIPEWITAANNGGTAYSYGLGACVLYSASGNAPFTVYRSVVANNTQTPGTGNNWQAEIFQAAASTDIVAGTSNALIVTPLALTSYPGNSAQTFNVGSAITATQAAQAVQVQKSAFNYAGLAGGTANALTATLTPAPTAYSDGLRVVVRVASNNTGGVSLNVNGLGAVVVIGAAHQVLQGGELVAGGFACFVYSSNYSEFILEWATGGAMQVGAAIASYHAVQLAQLATAIGTTQPLGDSSLKFATTEFAARLGLKYTAVTAITGNKTMTTADLGGVFPVQVTADITLPLASSVPVGSTYTFFYYQSASVPTFIPSGSDVFSAGAGNISTFTPKNTGYIQFTAEISGLWELSGSGTLDQSSGFSSSASYFKMPNGKIVAWVYGAASIAGVSNTMPITFPNAIRTISVTCNSAKGGAVYAVGGNISSTSVVDATATGSCNVFIIAIGD